MGLISLETLLVGGHPEPTHGVLFVHCTWIFFFFSKLHLFLDADSYSVEHMFHWDLGLLGLLDDWAPLCFTFIFSLWWSISSFSVDGSLSLSWLWLSLSSSLVWSLLQSKLRSLSWPWNQRALIPGHAAVCRYNQALCGTPRDVEKGEFQVQTHMIRLCPVESSPLCFHCIWKHCL